MVSFATLIALLFLSVFGAMVFNAGKVVTRKIEIQNAADSVAYSSTVWVARGMNAVTAANHMMGELQALYVLHHSLGGKWLDEKSSSTKNSNEDPLPELNDELATLFDGTGKQFNPIKGGGGFFNRIKRRILGRAIKSALSLINRAFPLDDVDIIPAVKKAHDTVIEDPSADKYSTIFEAKVNLKEHMINAYTIHRIGWITYFVGDKLAKSGFPFVAQIGLAMMATGAALEAAALAYEMVVWKEYLVLDGVEALAHGLKGAKKQIPSVLRGLALYQDKVLRSPGTFLPGTLGGVIGKSADQIAEFHDAEAKVRCAINPLSPLLPVERHTTKNDRRSQLIRATYPWVTRWRTPVNTLFRQFIPGIDLPVDVPFLPLSEADRLYTKWTNIFTYEACHRTRLDRGSQYSNFNIYGMGDDASGFGIDLLVIKGLNDTAGGIHKSDEEWAHEEGMELAEDLFTLVGYVRTKSPPEMGAPAVYRQENPGGVVCFAQSMIYNANFQQAPKKSTTSGAARQPRVAWDTLNWNAGDIREWSRYDDTELDRDPEIKLNWQAKLTPATPRRLAATATSLIPTNMGGPLLRSRNALYLNNH